MDKRDREIQQLKEEHRRQLQGAEQAVRPGRFPASDREGGGADEGSVMAVVSEPAGEEAR